MEGFLPSASQFHTAAVSERDSAFNVALAREEQFAAPVPYEAAREQARLMDVGRSQSLAMMPMPTNGPVRSWQQGLSGLASRSAGGGFAGRASRYAFGDRLGSPTGGGAGSPVSFSNFNA